MARKPSAWNIFVKKVYKENPGKTFGQCLKIAATLKKQGKMNGNGNASMKTKTKKRKSRRR
jgi:hypothetical protein